MNTLTRLLIVAVLLSAASLLHAQREGRRAGDLRMTTRLKAGDAAPRVGVTLARDLARGQVVLRVADNGPGVPMACRERIFEPFFRLPGASERDGGVGLGLALVKTIAGAHGASVACVEPPTGRGATFEVVWSI